METNDRDDRIQRANNFSWGTLGAASGMCFILLIVLLIANNSSDVEPEIHGYTAAIPSPFELKDEPVDVQMKELTELDQLRNKIIFKLQKEYRKGQTLHVWLQDRQHQNKELMGAIQKELKASGWQGPLAVSPEGWYLAIHPDVTNGKLAQLSTKHLNHLDDDKRAETKLKLAQSVVEELRTSWYVVYIGVDFFLELNGKLADAERHLLSDDHREAEELVAEVFDSIRRYRSRCDTYKSLRAEVEAARCKLSDTLDLLVPTKYEATRLANVIRDWQSEPAPDPEVRKHLGDMEYMAHIYAIYFLKHERDQYHRGLEMDRAVLEKATDQIKKGKFEMDLTVVHDKQALWSKVDDTIERMNNGIDEVDSALQVVQPFFDQVDTALDEAGISRDTPYAKGERLEIERAIARKFFEASSPKEK